MAVMLQNGVIPVINENDTVSVTELMFTDNDELSGLVASMMNAETLILLSNVDGIYDGSPKDARSSVIQIVNRDYDLRDYIQTERSGFGRGGMITKANIAKKVAEEGIKVIIANGKRDNILIHLAIRPKETLHTEFHPQPASPSNIKKWIAHSESFTKGTAFINRNAVEALKGDKAVSLLLVGVIRIEGEFEEGDLISIVDEKGKAIAIGRSSYTATEARKNMGVHELKPLVHYDYLYLE